MTTPNSRAREAALHLAALTAERDELNAQISDALGQISHLDKEIAGWKADQKENLKNQCELVGQLRQALAERDALRSENGSLRELMNTYNIGGWTDSLSLIEERGSLKKAARFALDALEYHTAQTRPIERTQIAIKILKAVL